MADVCLMTKGMMMNPNTLAPFGHDVNPIVAPIPRKPCSISSDHFRRSWPELAALSSSPERRAGQEILSILFSRAAVMSPTGNSIPPTSLSSASTSSSAPLSPSKTVANRHRFSYDARVVSSSGRMVGAMTFNDDDAEDLLHDDNDDENENVDDVDDHVEGDESSNKSPLFSQQQQRQPSSSSSSLNDDPDSETWDTTTNSSQSSGTRLESMSPAISSDSPSPVFLLGVTPPKRADNPLAFDRTFFSLASSSVAIGAELGLLNFSPPLRDAH